jgi:hypothetical protein
MSPEKYIPDWVEDLPDNQAQPWMVKQQGDFISIRQRDGGDRDTHHWVLIHIDEVEDFISQVRQEAAK